jgi:uncharacterized protein
MKTKPFTFLLALTFLFLFSGFSIPFLEDFQDGMDAFGKKDFKTAHRILLKVAKKGNASAQYYLGSLYHNGQGVPQDINEAVKWYRLAAEQADENDWGITFAQYALAKVYFFGVGTVIPQDYKEAAKWYQLALKHKEAVKRLGEKDILYAQSNLGWVYDQVLQDYKEALKWYQLAGDASSQNNIAVIYEHGRKGVPQDYKEALKWYRLSAEKGHAAAQNNLGVMYINGKGVPKDDKEGFKWNKLAAEQGYARGQYFVGFDYAMGEIVQKDYVLAHMWWNLAITNGHKGAAEQRNNMEEQMTPQQIEKAQEMAINWKPNK